MIVCGPVNCTKIKVVTNWWDEVFDDNYEINPLTSLKAFIKKEHNLPEIPTEAEIETNGLHVGQMICLQMKKIEELTLYVIGLYESNIALKEQVKIREQNSKRKVKNN